MAKLVWLCTVAVTFLLGGAVSAMAQAVTYEKSANGHWMVVSSQGGSASPASALSAAAGAKNAGTIAPSSRPAAVTASPDSASVKVAAIVPPTGAPHPVSAAPATTPAVPRLAPNATYQGGSSAYSALNPLSWSVHVYKSRHLLEVYYKGHIYRSYHAVFGRSHWAGAKEWEGDMRTPEGDYLIVAKHPSRRFGWFLALNYPNEIDRARFVHLRAIGQIPPDVGEGGHIGIHGTESPLLNVGDVNWTTGCISVDNSDIRELDRLLPVGTLVVINP